MSEHVIAIVAVGATSVGSISLLVRAVIRRSAADREALERQFIAHEAGTPRRLNMGPESHNSKAPQEPAELGK
jgi:hypothetical protein